MSSVGTIIDNGRLDDLLRMVKAHPVHGAPAAVMTRDLRPLFTKRRTVDLRSPSQFGGHLSAIETAIGSLRALGGGANSIGQAAISLAVPLPMIALALFTRRARVMGGSPITGFWFERNKRTEPAGHRVQGQLGPTGND
jgi:hypothetical protein